jgi:predicted oxidoreductase
VVDRGVTFIDTADSYGPGISETLITKALYPYPAGHRQGWWWQRRAGLRDPVPTVGSPIVGPSICAAPVRTA